MTINYVIEQIYYSMPEVPISGDTHVMDTMTNEVLMATPAIVPCVVAILNFMGMIGHLAV